MRRIALINQKGGVGKTTTAANLGAALAEAGKRVVVLDLDPQGNLTLHLGVQLEEGAATTYRILLGDATVAQAVRPTTTAGLSIIPTDIDLSGAELELAGAFGRETLLRDAVNKWVEQSIAETGEEPADYLILDCPPSLGLLSVNGLATAEEVMIVVQTEFFALQGLSKLVDVVDLIQTRIHPALRISGIVPCLYDNRLRLDREVLGELHNYFPGLVFRQQIGTNVKLAEAPSFGQTIFQYAPTSAGARDYRALAELVLAQAGETTAPLAERDRPAGGNAASAPDTDAAAGPGDEASAESAAATKTADHDELTPARPPHHAPAQDKTTPNAAPEHGAHAANGSVRAEDSIRSSTHPHA